MTKERLFGQTLFNQQQLDGAFLTAGAEAAYIQTRWHVLGFPVRGMSPRCGDAVENYCRLPSGEIVDGQPKFP